MEQYVYKVSQGCTLCGMCIYECPNLAISMTKHGAVIKPELCIACGICAENCASEAIVKVKKSEI